ncbi:MAG: hypothetical protein A3H96_09660 [Acidobacteria bacterium RIFCSPLOWO2_02_FULL_67_36]|nr:MAG: hypothetical protein A3H96_09660 [Acidobacteria bacterium RIFCSPLOWO2_02_FULL_67_36]OFW24963.1 MAG: hypothetical protein A3G21_16080 [Acidobacteria bacterium RIFCSPLOWO2_12_FULL_66_21]
MDNSQPPTSNSQLPYETDVAIVGAGAAGLATAIFTRRLNPRVRVLVLEGARRPGAKILVSGGSRCNVTNATVTERDFWGGRRTIIRTVLRAFPVPDTVAFFAGLGVTLHEEEDGRLFPDTNRARDVLEALLIEVRRAGAQLATLTRVLAIAPSDGGFQLQTAGGAVHARAVVLATGGQSLPKSGSDGAGFEFAERLGHTIVPATPALVPLLLRDEPGALHRRSTGVAHPVELSVWIDGRVAIRLAGSLLWTHFGISGPVALNASRHWLRGQLEGRAVRLTASFDPGERLETIDARWTALARERPRAALHTALSAALPASVARALLEIRGIEGSTALARLTRDDRRHLAAPWRNGRST